MPDAVSGETVVATTILTVNGVSILQTTEVFRDYHGSPPMGISESLGQVIDSLEKALRTLCRHRDLRSRPPATILRGVNTRLKSPKQGDH
jgi:hypothetical protein